MNKIGTFIFGFTFTCNGFIHAQLEVKELDPVTITSSLHATKISQTGRNITYIRGDEFSKLPVSSIDELLRHLPGVEVQMRGPGGSQSDIVLRGGTFQQVLVVLDGIRLNDPNTGHFNSYIPIAPAEIDHIEILKGASSAIYGSEAVGGVIHIITKSFTANKDRSAKQMSLEGKVGQYSLVDANMGGFYQEKNTAIGAGLLSNNSDGQKQRGTRGFYNNSTGSLSFKQFIGNNWSMAARSSFDLRNFSAQNFYTTFVSDTATEKVNSFWNQLHIQHQKGKHTLMMDAGYKAVKDNYKYNPSSIPNNNRSYLIQSNFTDNYHFAANTHLVTGLQFQHKWIRSNDRGDHQLSQLAPFIILDQSIGNFTFSPSLRLDWNERRGSEWVPQINLSYHFQQFQLRASAGKTIRDADFTERYNNYNKTFVSGGSVGNPDLEAERSFSYEAGFDYFVSNHIKLSSTIFQRRHSQLIDWVTTSYNDMPRKDNLSPTGTYALASNISKVNTTGAEIDVQFIKTLDKEKNLFATLGLVWLDSKSGGGTPSFYISSHAKFLTNFNVRFTNKIFAIAVNGIYKNRKPREATAINAKVDENCFMINAKGEIFLWMNKLSAFLQMDNITDNRCADLLGTIVPGQWIMTGLKLELK